MNSRLFYYTLFIAAAFSGSCKNKSRPAAAEEKHPIVILPFSGTDSSLVADLRTGLQKRLNATITIAAGQPLPVTAFYQPRRRYIADSLLVGLQEYGDNRYKKVIGITEKDIATRKGHYANWGIMGLGFCPGKACIISSCRPRKQADYQHLVKRMIVLALHELGHTYGLPHCASDTCIMKDAGGKMNLDDGEFYCNDCTGFLRKAGILPAP